MQRAFRAFVCIVSLFLVQGGALAQTCMYDSIPATAPASRFSDNSDGTVTDTATGLQWKRCSEGQTWDGATCTGIATTHSWQQALQLADGASYAGNDDWRLPNIKELASIVEQACREPAIDLEVFPALPSAGVSNYWSSSPHPYAFGFAWYVTFFYGEDEFFYPQYSALYVRLVRGIPVSPLNDTGLDWWADLTTNYLTSEPADYPGQDATYGRDTTQDDDADGHAGFVFTKLDANGDELLAGATNWSCVRDGVTGLTWESKSDDSGLRDKNWTYTWYNPDVATNGGSAGAPDGTNDCFDPARCDTDKFTADVNATGLCGASDWRLPTREELRSIVDYSRADVSIDTDYFRNIGTNGEYWSSSPQTNPGLAWSVAFDNYGGDTDANKFEDINVRLVRGQQAATSDLPSPIRVTNAAGLDVRTDPGTSYSAITDLDFGQEFVAFEKDIQGEDTWYKIHLPCGNTGVCSGWVPGSYQGVTHSVEVPASTQVEVVNSAPLGLNIRVLPNSSVLDSAYDGQRFVTFNSSLASSGCSSPWYEIYLPRASYAETGWVCGDYVQLVGAEQGAVLSLQGSVTLAGAPLSGVDLTLTGAATASASSETDGVYAFSALANGIYTVTPALASYAFSPASRTVTLSGASVSGRDFRACDSAASLTGYVVDADANSAPLMGVTVDVDGVPGATTDASGFYAIPGLPCGVHDVSVRYGEYEPYDRSFDTFDGTQLDVQLRKPQYGIDPNGGSIGDPVNTATGNYVYQRRDLEILGIGMPLRFDRAYNSREASKSGAASGPLGYGWTHSYDVHLGIDAGIVTITWGDGHTETFTPDGLGGYTPQYGVFDTLADNGDGTYTLTKRDRTAYNFDTSNRLSSIVDKNGNTLSLVYAGGNLTEILDTAGRSVSLDHDGGRLTLITDPIGRTVQYAYDANGDLISATDTNGNVTQYTYDASHQILTVVDPRGNTVVTNTYDGANRVVTYQTDAKGNGTSFAYQELDRITTITDALGNVTVHHHDELLRLTREEDARGGIALYDYDSRGNRIQVTDKNGNVTQYDYDQRGNVTRKTDALGNVTEITYDADDNPLTRTDALGNLTQFAYDANGNLTETTDALGNVSAITYEANGLPLTVTDPLGNVTTNAYDGEGNLAQITDALGNVTAYSHDGVGRRLTETDALGRVTAYAYDGNDNLLTVTDALGGIVTHSYDSNDNKTSTTDRNGNATQWAYDEKDLLISETDALGNAAVYAYDALDRRLSRTDRRGNTTQYAYDEVGNRVGMTDALGNATTYSYDLNGNRLSMTDARGNTTSYEYDTLNRRTRVTDALGNSVVTAYDALGRVVSVTAPGGRVTQSAYDDLGRLLQVTDPEGGVTQHSYDANGNRTGTTDANGNTTTFGYDALNRQVQVTDALGQSSQSTYDAVGNRVSATNALGNATSFGYDALDRLVATTDPLGNTNTSAYDAGGRVTAVTDANGRTTIFAYDVLDRLVQVTDAAAGSVSYVYDENGNRTAMTDPNGNLTTYAYDALNRRTTMTEPLGNITGFVYDEVGNLSQKTDPKGQLIQYAYDALNRRTGIDYPAQPDVAFTYDAVGNLLTMTDGVGTTTHTYNLLDRRTSTTDPYGNLVGYGYDAVGNRTSLTYPGGNSVNYAFDAVNRMATVTDWIGNVTAYGYDAANRPTGATNANGTTTDYVYDAANRLTALTNAKSDASVINAYSYTLDPVGNHQSEERTEPLAPVIPAEVVTDTHDAENRLTESNGVANSIDANGNMTAKGANSYAYDAADRLIETSIDGTLTQFQYDGLGNRYTRIRGGVETRFVLDTNTALTNVLMETNGAGIAQAYNVYGQGLISRILPDDSVLQYHYDSRGSTIGVTDTTESAVQQYAYDPFGRVVNTNGATGNPFEYLGQFGVVDDGGNLNYIRARYYESEQQRFISKDLRLGDDLMPQTLNRYAYAINNPIRFLDISGFSAKDAIDGAATVAGPSNTSLFTNALLSNSFQEFASIATAANYSTANSTASHVESTNAITSLLANVAKAAAREVAIELVTETLLTHLINQGGKAALEIAAQPGMEILAAESYVNFLGKTDYLAGNIGGFVAGAGVAWDFYQHRDEDPYKQASRVVWNGTVAAIGAGAYVGATAACAGATVCGALANAAVSTVGKASYGLIEKAGDGLADVMYDRLGIYNRAYNPAEDTYNKIKTGVENSYNRAKGFVSQFF